MQDIISENNYIEKRNELLTANANRQTIILRDEEKELDRRLAKWREEYRRSCDEKDLYALPLFSDKASQSRLYGFCRRMPKGADLHVHDMALLPPSELIPVLRQFPHYCINRNHAACDLLIVPEEEPVPAGYARFSRALEEGIYTEKVLEEKWTFAGAGASNRAVWDFFEWLFCRQDAMSWDIPFAEEYYRRAFRYYCENRVTHLEIRLMTTSEMDLCADYARAILRAYYDVKKDYPAFTVRIIGAGAKADSGNIELSRKCFLNASYIQETVKDESDPDHPEDFLIGFDLVNEEDGNLPLSHFAPMLLKAKRQYPAMKFYLHSGESRALGNENLIDAYLLGVSRVGHGLNLYQYPDLHARYIDAEICLEICPVSNCCLGYVDDLRSHPATEYLRSGAAVCLCSDDPAFMERCSLTDDFFSAILAWDLGPADLKQLALNSILYCGLEKERKLDALKAFKEQWNDFVAEELADDFVTPETFTFHRIKNVSPLPDYRLSVQFRNGVTKQYDMKPLFDEHLAFNRLKEEPAMFSSVYVDAGGYGILWNEDLDLACDELWANGTIVDAAEQECGTAAR